MGGRSSRRIPDEEANRVHPRIDESRLSALDRGIKFGKSAENFGQKTFDKTGISRDARRSVGRCSLQQRPAKK